MIGSIPSSYEEAARLLLPALRGPTSPTGAWERALHDPDVALVRLPFAPFLDLCLILDLPGVRRFVSRAHAAAWGADPAALRWRALDNLPVADGLRPWSEGPGVWALEGEDGNAASRLALPGFLRSFEGKVPGRPVAFVPDAGSLWVTGEDAGRPLLQAFEQAWERFQAAGTPVAPAGYSIVDGRVAPWVPPAGHPLHHDAATRHRLHAGHEYRRQHADLQAWIELHGSADYVAPFSVLKRADGRTVSFACWQDGPTLLPWVEYVVLGAPKDLHAAPWVPWPELAPDLPDPEPEVQPVRYRVLRYPEWLKALRPPGPPW